MRNDFTPVSLQRANAKLDKHILSAILHNETNKGYKKNVFKPKSLWRRVLNIFKGK